MTKLPTLEEYDDSWVDQVSQYLMSAGRREAEFAVQENGTISFQQWLLNALKTREENHAKIIAARNPERTAP